MEKVIVVATDSEERPFIKCFPHIDDAQLEDAVADYIGKKTTFFVIYKEDLFDLEDALAEMNSPVKGHGKLSFDDIRTIQQMMASGDFKQKEVAANFGVSRQTIWQVCKEPGI